LPRQNVVTREGLSIIVDGVLYYKVFDANRALFDVSNLKGCIGQMALTKVRETIATRTYEQIQLERTTIAESLRVALDNECERWGIDVTRLLLTEVNLSPAMQLAKQAESEAKLRAVAGMAEAEGLAGRGLIAANNNAKTEMIAAENAARIKIIEAEAAARAKVVEAEGTNYVLSACLLSVSR
jgi:regulator of protease activity HflC (stomatin/prohibitin superfamily)